MKLICYSDAMLHERDLLDERTANLIATQVAAAIRDEVQTLLAASAHGEPATGMTVDQVAARLGVARSTVYAHWREWGGYKLGRGDKAPIRFDAARLPTPTDRPASDTSAARGPARCPRPRPRRTLIQDAPRFTDPIDEMA
jgi:transposase-like protein